MYEILARKDGQLRNDIVANSMGNQFETVEDAVEGIRNLQKLDENDGWYGWNATYFVAQITDSEDVEGYDVVKVVDPIS